MRRIALLILLLCVGLGASAKDSLTHQSVVVYKFKDFNMILVAQHITDSLLDYGSINSSWSARQRKITARGDILQVYFTKVGEPFNHPVRKVAFDESASGQQPTTAEDLEIRFAYVDVGHYGNWKDIVSLPLLNKDSLSLFPFNPGKLAVAKGEYYVLRDQANMVYPILEIRVRHKITKEEIIQFQARAVDEPVSPFLILETQDDTNKKLIDSFHKVRENLMAMPDVEIRDGKVVPREPSKKPDIPKILHNEPLFKTSELVLYFQEQRGGYPDSSLEFRLLNQLNPDTSWKKTGHRLIIPTLASGEQYKLQVRYELHPGHGQEYTFYVVPKWYQTKQARIIFLGLLITGGLLTWLIFYRRQLRSSRRRREQLTLEVKAIRSQLNPHFIFNALSSIQGLINKNEIPAANRYLTEFSSLLRDTLHNSEKEMVPLVNEAHLLDTYLKLEQLRFNFQYQINIDGAIDKNGTEIPNLLLQPLVENAVKHGAGPLGEQGVVRVDFIQRDQDMLVTIIDNGNRFHGSLPTEGYGLKLTRNRLSLLAETLKEQPIELTMERSANGETIVLLVFKNWL